MQRTAEAEVGRREWVAEPAVTIRAEICAGAEEDSEGSDSKREELYHALSAQRTFVWQIYFFSIALFTVLLIHRCFSASHVSGLTLEVLIAFFEVTAVLYFLLVFNSAKVTPRWVCGLYQQVGAMGMWLFTAGWMVLYTTHIPPPLYHPRQWGIAAFFVLVTLAMSLLSKMEGYAFLFGPGY